MLSPRGGARLGLGAACAVFALSFGVLVSGAAAARRAERLRTAAKPNLIAPDFTLPDARGGSVRLADLRGSSVVLYVTSIRCDISNSYNERLAAFGRKYAEDGRVKVLALHCDLGDGPLAQSDRREIPVQSHAAGLDFPQLLDHDGETARRYGADRTPTFFVIDAAGVIRYRGSFDDNVSPSHATAHFLDDALQHVLAGQPVARPATEVFGCAIKREG